MVKYLSSSHSSIPYFEPSRPMPDSLTPPNGATSVEMKPVFSATIPASSASPTRQARPHLVEHAALDENPVRRDACLAGIAELAGHERLHHQVEVGVVEDEEGRVAAELERDLLHRPRALLHQQLADRGRAREAEL